MTKIHCVLEPKTKPIRLWQVRLNSEILWPSTAQLKRNGETLEKVSSFFNDDLFFILFCKIAIMAVMFPCLPKNRPFSLWKRTDSLPLKDHSYQFRAEHSYRDVESDLVRVVYEQVQAVADEGQAEDDQEPVSHQPSI